MGKEGVEAFSVIGLDIPVLSEDERERSWQACRFAGHSDGLQLFLVHQEARHAVQSGSITFEQLVVECGVGVRNKARGHARSARPQMRRASRSGLPTVVQSICLESSGLSGADMMVVEVDEHCGHGGGTESCAEKTW